MVDIPDYTDTEQWAVRSTLKERYGTEKPDLRFGLEIKDLSDIAAGTAVIKIGTATTLHDTIHANIEGDYTIKFSEVEQLSDDDIYIIKEILDAELSTESNKVRDQLLRKGKIAISNKMNISNDMPARSFLETVLKDYNFHFGKL